MQYVPLQTAKFRIKSYELYESSTVYEWSFIIYTGQGMEMINWFMNSDTNKTTAVVIKPVEPLLGHSHILWTDNFITAES
jgi:hypothetical protein